MKQMRIRYRNLEISSGTKISDFIPILMEFMTIVGNDAEVDDHHELCFDYETEETDEEYNRRLDVEKRTKAHQEQVELRQYQALKEKFKGTEYE